MKTYHCTVHPRNPDRVNPAHEYVDDHNVHIPCNPIVGHRFHIYSVDGGGVHTSLVVAADIDADGNIDIVTLNTVYRLRLVANDT